MVAANHIKESAVRSLITIGCRGKTKPKSVDPNALRLLTTLTNVLTSEILLRAANSAKASGRSTVTLDDFRRVLPGVLLDFSI
ncbi:hypothetical protein KIN20_009345 [Parelaphostrongylus tenuis]|uniref:Centromere protein X n=1 Tax=Parelaphostrongylus tenuis TaxID=148309 RepID=A0AAD5MRN4_PARTN|nr:hypothetical protein KIN20_009345 [Parelaphostrongylus tenuis]